MWHRRIEIVLFAFAFAAYAYFHQGGGWNQNARFALTRALVESRQPWIDDYFVYALDGAKDTSQLRRVAVRNGCFTDAGRLFALAWYGDDRTLTPVAPDAPPDAYRLPADWAGVSGDVAFAYGHLHPNKAPGTSFAAVPGYALAWGVERMTGVNPDDARVMTINAWLSGVAGMALVAALGVVVFWRLAMRLSGDRVGSALFATLAFAFGTLYFPYATMLLEHDLVAVALLCACLLVFGARSPARLFGAGLCAGAAVVFSYLSIVAVVLIAGYVAWRVGRPRGVLAFAAGTIPPFVVLAAYNIACFGKLVATNYAWENPIFKEAGGGVLELFASPRADVLLALLVSPTRGLFVGTPVLVLGVIGLVAMLRRPDLRPEGLLFAAMIAHIFLFNMSFTAWKGGWACGPRYLIPAIPFLALPIAVVPKSAAWVQRTLLAISIAAMALVTVVDPEPPQVSPEVWEGSPIWAIGLPQLLHGRPGAFASAHWPEAALSMYVEPVSTNPNGVYSGTPARFFPLGSPQTRWNSFNVGESVFPGRRASVLPLLLLAAVFAVFLRREAARARLS
jgi:hypothetical protein